MGLFQQPKQAQSVAESRTNGGINSQTRLVLRKILLCVWWNFEGVIHYELVPNNRTINVDLGNTQNRVET